MQCISYWRGMNLFSMVVLLSSPTMFPNPWDRGSYWASSKDTQSYACRRLRLDVVEL